MTQTLHQVEQSATLAYLGQRERIINDLTNQPLEKESLFIIKESAKILDVWINSDLPYYFEDFKTLAKGHLTYIHSIEPQPWLGENCYCVYVSALATPEQIEAELEKFVLPF